MDQACVNELGAHYFSFPASGRSLLDYLNDGTIDHQFIESLDFSAQAFDCVYDLELDPLFQDSQLEPNIPPSEPQSGSTTGHYDLNTAYGSDHHSPPPDPPSPTQNNIYEHPNTTPQGEVEAEDMAGMSNVAWRGVAGSGDHQERLTTWSSYNSHLPLNHTKQRRQLTDAEKGTMRAHRANIHSHRDVLESDIKEMIAQHHKDIEDLALKHGKKTDYIKKIVTNQTCYKTSRNVSLHNAIIHHKNQEINATRPLGERVPLNEIQKMAKIDPQLQNLSDARKKELVDALEEHRKVKEHGLRASSMSASLDVRATMDRIGSEVRYHSFDWDYQAYFYPEMDKLSIRTGIRAFAFISKSHLIDVSTPGWLGSGDVVGFFPAVLKMSVDNFSAKFEQWSITQDRRPPPVDSLKAVRVECTSLIIKGLSTITGRPSIKMNYLNYDTSIVAMHHVKLVGWPEHIPFGNPSNISDVTSVRRLRRALQDGECKWVKLTERQQKEHDEMLEGRRRAGQVVGVKRKQRSDKGGTHQKTGRRRSQVQDEDNDDQQPELEEPSPETESRRPRPKCRANAQIPPSVKSKEYIDDEPSGSGGDYDDEDGDIDNDNDNEYL